MARTINYPNGVFDETIRAGDSVAWELTDTESDGTTPVDNTGRSAVLQVRATADSESADLELTSDDGGGITLGGSDGTIGLSMTAAQTRALAPGTWVWALRMTTDDSSETLFSGSLLVLPEVVRV